MFPLVEEIAYQDPKDIFALFAHQPYAIFLDSAQYNTNSGRYSFIAIDPFLTITDSFLLLQEKLQKFHLDQHKDLPPFQGGAAGYFSYDLVHCFEKIPAHSKNDLEFPDLILGFYDIVFAFDHFSKKSWIFSSGFPEINLTPRTKRAEQRLRYYSDIVKNLVKNYTPNNFKIPLTKKITATFTQEQYQTMVSRVKQYIFAGDIFQANLSQRFSAEVAPGVNFFDLYCQLRETNPAPFAAYLNFENIILASASPERFIKLNNNLVETKPIKGTRRRDSDPEKDLILIKDLLNSTKDRAENIMIVDLLRNDLSKVCRNHSVTVTKLCELESFATVHHLVSTITAELKPDKTAIDLLSAVFPGGSITGAPKIRAMEIIAELEPTARGPYCGSIGYIGFDGSMDLSITIRTYAINNNIITFQAGGGIVADSDPELEYQESLTKAAALKKILEHDFINR